MSSVRMHKDDVVCTEVWGSGGVRTNHDFIWWSIDLSITSIMLIDQQTGHTSIPLNGFQISYLAFFDLLTDLVWIYPI